MARQNTALSRELRAIRTEFKRLARSFEKIAPVLWNGRLSLSTKSNSTPRQRPRLTAKQRAALKLQGRYMGTMRGLKPTDRARVKRIRAAKGIRAAISFARGMRCPQGI